MKKTFILLLLSLFALSSFAFGDTETRSLESFDQVRASNGIKAILIKGSSNKAEIDAEGVDLDKVITEVEDGQLIVKIESKWWKMGWNNKRKVTVKITYVEDLEEISSSSGASVSAENTIVSDDLELSASSGARIELEVQTDHLDADVSSGATIRTSGEAKDVSVDVSSGSSFKGYELETENADLDASSGASIKISVSDKLTADASSGASISYKGSPESTNIDKSSGGSVKNY